MVHRVHRSTALALALAVVLSAGLASGAPTDADARRKLGIDVSRFQEWIHWKKVSQTRARFAIIQASRGSGSDCEVVPERCGADEWYPRNYRKARRHGLRVGPYHRAFASGRTGQRARFDARREAKLFAETVGSLRRSDLIPTLDVETPFKRLNSARLIKWIETWTKVVERRLGVPSMIYTNHSSWQATGDTTQFAERGTPLWVANFDVRRPLVPAADWAGEGWSIWQYTSSGRIRGVEGAVDRNWARVPLRSLSVGKNPPLGDPPAP